MKTIIAEREAVLRRAAEQIGRLLKEKQEAALVLGANDDCLALYRVLRERAEAGDLDLSRARFFSASEFEGLREEDARRCRARLEEALLCAVDPRAERSVFLSEDTVADYEARIADAGGLDLAVVGVGQRGRLCLNEPATPYDSPTHRQKLTRATKRELAGLFGGEEQTPDYGYTVGIRTIVEARSSLVIALGEDRADPVFRMLYARNDSVVPAAFLQLPPQVTVYLDEAAAAKL